MEQIIAFRLEEQGTLCAEALVRIEPQQVYNIFKTYVAPEQRGKGLAAQVVAQAVDYIRRQEGTFKADCCFAAAFLTREKISFIAPTQPSLTDLCER